MGQRGDSWRDAWTTWILTVRVSGLNPRFKRQRWTDWFYKTRSETQLKAVTQLTCWKQSIGRYQRGEHGSKCHCVVLLLSAERASAWRGSRGHRAPRAAPGHSGWRRDCPVMMTEPHPLSRTEPVEKTRKGVSSAPRLSNDAPRLRF